MEELNSLSKEQLGEKIKDLIDSLKAVRVIMEDTITEPGGDPTPEARAEFEEHQAVLQPLLSRSIKLFLEPTRITSNNNFDNDVGGTRKRYRKRSRKNRTNRKNRKNRTNRKNRK